jgi:UDP-N-acetylmuramoyl-L-alanyl-D-glutamate--2,6-diaminopimelate ligase
MTGERTTPEASELQQILGRFVDEGRQAAAIEVSSVGLERHRVDGTWFAAGIFTNLTPDELTIHGSVERYFEAKASLFQPDRCGVAVVNADDEWGRRILEKASTKMAPFSHADAHVLREERSSTTFVWRGRQIVLPLPGEFNVMNALAAATAAAALGLPDDVISAGLSSVQPLPGHAADVDAGQPFRVVVDFAHSGGGLAAVLQSVRRAAAPRARIHVVFGCGGNRDSSRRPIMGRAAAENADVVHVTSDNPRHEEPMAIIEEIVAGAREGGHTELRVEPDRRVAIEQALAMAGAGDVVVIAGKGHETGQIVGDETLPFDDTEVAREALARLDRTGWPDGAEPEPTQ